MKYAIGDVIETKYIYFTSTVAIGCVIEIYQGNITVLYKILIAGTDKKYYWLTESDISHKL